MRAISAAAFRSGVLSLGLLAWIAAPTAQVLAQDEFGDEFGDEPSGPPAAPARPAPAGGDEFGDDFDDEVEARGELQADLADLDYEAPPAEHEAAGPRDEEQLRAQRFRAGNTLNGPVGGIHVVDAASGAVDSFRVQLATEFFFASDFLEPGDDNDHIGGYLSLSWTVHEMVELYASIASYANSNPMEDPALFQVLGDTILGLKVFYDALPFLTVGGDIGIGLLNTVGDIGLVLGSTSFGIRGNMSLDFRGLPSPVPFIGRLNLGYWFDNSSNLIEDVEEARYNALPADRLAREDENRHLITRIERFALGINRTDFFNIGIGLEAPLRAAEDLYIHPLLEWTWGIPVNRQGFDCLFLPIEEGSDEPVEGEDGCLDKQGLSAFPMNLTLGVRVLPPVRGLSGFAAVDIGLTGTSTFVRELAATAPYNVMLGLSYAYDTRPAPDPEPIIQEVERRVEVQIPLPPKGRINGVVVEEGANAPIGGAQVAFVGTDLNPIVATEQGTFASYQFDPGEVQMVISHPEYNPGGCVATVPEGGGDVEVRCELVALPRVGQVQGIVRGDEGATISTQILIEGPENRTARSDASGRFSAEGLTPGSYTARVEAENHLIKLQQFEVQPRETTQLDITLVPRPRQAMVQVQRNRINIRRQINFATDSAEILPSSFPLMEEIADVMLRNPELTKIEIQGHTDNRGTADHNMQLSQQRAESVRTWLSEHGVQATRLEARGYGMTQPLVPNITPANRARNRRVQFVIQERAGQ